MGGRPSHEHRAEVSVERCARTRLRGWGVATDITARKKGEEALLRKETYLEEGQKLSHTGTGVGMYTRRGFLVTRDVSHLGIDPDQTKPTREAFFQILHPRTSNLSLPRRRRCASNIALNMTIGSSGGRIDQIYPRHPAQYSKRSRRGYRTRRHGDGRHGRSGQETNCSERLRKSRR